MLVCLGQALIIPRRRNKKRGTDHEKLSTSTSTCANLKLYGNLEITSLIHLRFMGQSFDARHSLSIEVFAIVGMLDFL